MRRSLTAGVCLLAACTQDIDLRPIIADDVKSVLLVFGPELIEIEAHDGSLVRRERVALETTSSLVVLLYASSLDELNLRPGSLSVVEHGAPVPMPDHIHSTILGDGGASEWTDQLELPEWIRALEIDVVSPEECLASGGCLLPRVASVALSCVSPCPRPAKPEPPGSPDPPSLVPCPAGWREDARDDVTVCAPFAAQGPEVCPPGARDFPGVGCEPLGEPCGPGRFADDLPAGRLVRYVDLGAQAGGDGSLASPFDSIAAARANSPIDTVLALAEGAYTEVVPLDGLTVIGACAPGTVWRPTSALTLSSGAAELRQLTVEGTPTDSAVRVSRGGVIGLYDVVLTSASPAATLSMDGGSIEASGLAVEGGLHTMMLSSVSGHISRLWAQGSSDHGVLMFGSTIALSDATITGVPGISVMVQDSKLTAERLAIRDTVQGLVVRGATATATISDLVVGSAIYIGLLAHTSATVLVRRASVDDTPIAAIASDGARLRLEDASIRDVTIGPDGPANAMGATDGADLFASRVRVSRTTAGASCFDAGTTMTLEDTAIVDADGLSAATSLGFGISASDGCHLRLSRSLVDRATTTGIRGSLGAVLELDDVTVRETRPSHLDPPIGRGIELSGGAVATGGRIAISDSRQYGLALSDLGTRADLTDVSISRTRACSAICEGFTAGVNDGPASDLSLEGFELDDNDLTAVRHTGPAILHLRYGLITGQSTGITISDPTLRVEDVLEGVLIEDAEVPIDRIDN